MLTVDHVLRIIGQIVLPLTPRPVPLGNGGILAQDVRMDQDAPPFDRSQLDGYAVRSQDAKVDALLALAGHVDAGGPAFAGHLPPATCVGINTGGVVPPGADAVLMVEHSRHATRDEHEFIVVTHAVNPGYGIQPRGADARAGQIVLRAGTRLGPAPIAVCAAAGWAQPLTRRARVAVLSTGDELLDIATPTPLPAGKIRNSNQFMLGALAAEAGALVLDMGTCPDDAPRLGAALARGMADADLLVVCGGMSLGTRDLVPPMLKDLGVTLHVEKVLMKPGKPFVLGTLETAGGRKYVAGLPGNPVSAFVTFQRFVRAMLRHLEAAADGPKIVRARTDGALADNAEREFYLPCTLRPGSDGLRAEILAWKGSANIFTLAQANGLLIQAAGTKALPPGAAMDVLTW